MIKKVDFSQTPCQTLPQRFCSCLWNQQRVTRFRFCFIYISQTHLLFHAPATCVIYTLGWTQTGTVSNHCSPRRSWRPCTGSPRQEEPAVFGPGRAEALHTVALWPRLHRFALSDVTQRRRGPHWSKHSFKYKWKIVLLLLSDVMLYNVL